MNKGDPDQIFNPSHFIIGIDSSGNVVRENHSAAPIEIIEKYENLINAQLPCDYREFMEHTNGGQIDPEVADSVFFNVEKSYIGSNNSPFNENGLDSLFTFSNEGVEQLGFGSEACTMEYNYESFVHSEIDYPNRPTDFVPIGRTVGPGIIVIGIRGEHRGKVASYEFFDVRANLPLENVFHIANCFEEFLQRLY